MFELDTKLKARLQKALAPKEPLSTKQWGEKHIYIPPNYQSPYRGQGWSIHFFPLFQELLESVDDPEVRQITNLKCSQQGYSQNFLLPVVLKTLNDGYPVIACTAEQKQAEAFLIERLKPLLIGEAWNDLDIRERDQEIYLSNGGLLTVIHNSSKGGQRTRPAKILALDEYDIFKDASILERLKSRLTHYAGSKILIGSAPSPDATLLQQGDKLLSPIFLEFEQGSQAYYHLQDVNGEWFKLEFGFRKGKDVLPNYGIKWDKEAKNKDGTWDEQKVRASVHYLTPSGNKITEKDRDRLIQTGKWVHTFPERKSHLSYHSNVLYLHGGSFGDVAMGYLNAKRQGGIVFKTWLLEKFAEHIEDEKIDLSDRTLTLLRKEYSRGGAFFLAEEFTEHKGKPSVNIMTVDVQGQENGLWWMVTSGIKDVDGIGITDWGHCYDWSEIVSTATKYQCKHVAVDANYPARQQEVRLACAEHNMISILGRSKANFSMPFKYYQKDPLEGQSGHNRQTIQEAIIQSDFFKRLVFEMISGTHHSKLYIPHRYDDVLQRQITAETWDGSQFLEKHKDNHLLDCLVYAYFIFVTKQYLPS